MSFYSFLASLPAILATLGLVTFLILRAREKGDPITARIVDRLRAEAPERFLGHDKLSAKQLSDLLRQDQQLRSTISAQDFSLIERALRQQFHISVVVYLICASLFLIGVGLFVYQMNRPKPLVIDNIHVASETLGADGLAVDVDPLLVTWSSSGDEQAIRVWIENADTGERSSTFSTYSGQSSLSISNTDYSEILSHRSRGKFNRVRVVFQANDSQFRSKETKLHVGITVLAVVYDNQVKIAAMIDNSAVSFYRFEAKLVAWPERGLEPAHFGGWITGVEDYSVENAADYNWSTAKLAYLGPDDARLVRTEIIY